MRRIINLIIVLVLTTSFPILGYSQCKGFTKKECLPALEPYLYNGQLNSAVLSEGDVAELLLTFYGGQDYRILVCCQDILGKAEFKLLDTDRNEVFYNKDHDYVKSWDFNANSTQQLIIQVIIPPGEKKSDIVNSGCVSILVGFKEKFE